MKKNIGIIIDKDFKNDIRVSGEAKILSKKYNVFVLNCEKKNWFLKFFFFIQTTIPLYDYFWAFHIKRFIKKHNLCSIHVHDLYLAKAGFLAKGKLPLIVDLHENYPEAVLNYKWTQTTIKKFLSQPIKWSKKERTLLSYADAIIITNEHYRIALQKKYPELTDEKVFVYENVPDLAAFQSYPIYDNVFEKKNNFILFYFGVIAERRGILTLIKAVEILKPKYPELRLLLIGSVDKEESRVFKPLLNKSFITHHNWIDISFLPSYINFVDVCVCPIIKNEQHDTCFPNKIYQYALFGKPIIASNCLPQKDFIMKYNCGVIYKSEDISELSEKIEECINNPNLCNFWGENGKKSIQESCNLESIKDRLLNLYENYTI